jgi:hypothetical protein
MRPTDRQWDLKNIAKLPYISLFKTRFYLFSIINNSSIFKQINYQDLLHASIAQWQSIGFVRPKDQMNRGSGVQIPLEAYNQIN